MITSSHTSLALGFRQHTGLGAQTLEPAPVSIRLSRAWPAVSASCHGQGPGCLFLPCAQELFYHLSVPILCLGSRPIWPMPRPRNRENGETRRPPDAIAPHSEVVRHAQRVLGFQPRPPSTNHLLRKIPPQSLCAFLISKTGKSSPSPASRSVGDEVKQHHRK